MCWGRLRWLLVRCCPGLAQVHAFNTLRVVFNDSNMAMDSSGFHATGVVAAIRGMTAPAWEVSRAACSSWRLWGLDS